MAKRKKLYNNKYMRRYKPVAYLGAAAIGIGLGSSVIQGAGGSAAPLAAAGKYMPVAGTIVGGSIVLGHLNDLQKETRRYTKKRRK